MAAALLALLVAAPLGAAQGYDVLVSLSADDTLPSGPVRDEDLVFQAPGAVAHVAWPSETLSLMAGDGGTGNWPTFTDIDAVSETGGTTADEGLYISLASNEAGFLDGDILRGGDGNFTVWLPESAFVGITGATDGNVDVDAFQLDADGTILFSFGDNEDSAFLSSDGSGTVKDGDILILPFGAPSASILYTETEVNAMVTLALDSSSTITTTDTLSLARDPVNGAVLFTVQSPTADDATVFSTVGGGSIVPGHAEADFGFVGAPEIDALSVAVSHFPATTVSAPNPPEGGSVTVMLADAEPGVPHLVLASLGVVDPKPMMPGWGGFILKHDTLLNVCWGQALSLSIVPGATGLGSLVASLPAGLPPTDVVIQVVAPPASGPARASNPVLLQLAQ
ncbi:MAG TPA: hypothetical protein VFY71_03535 [Planctomycetota bacterium]|nr:hypothetical protein [Planctomycetota bacterium]